MDIVSSLVILADVVSIYAIGEIFQKIKCLNILDYPI